MSSTTNVISVTCGCGKRLKAPATAAGKRARCPQCGSVCTLPLPEPSRELVSSRVSALDGSEIETREVPAEEEDPFAVAYELAAREANLAAESNSPLCPKCQTALPGGAVLCVRCGYDSRTGRALAAAPVTSTKGLRVSIGKKPAKKIDYMAPTGSLVAGILFSAIAALTASVLWVVVAYATGLAIGYIAVLIGVAAGIGMQAGHKGQSEIGGMIAGVITALAIVVAKIVVLYAVLAKLGIHRSMWDFDSAKLGMYFFSPIGLIMIVVGIGAAYRTANGAIRD